MPGIVWAGNSGPNQLAPGNTPRLLANSLSGTGVPPAAALQAGDLVVLTTKSTLTSGGNVVTRMLLAADKTAHYKEGSPVAGIFGVATDSAQTNSVGVATNAPIIGAIATNAAIPYPLSGPAMWGNDVATGRSYCGIVPFTSETIFMARLYTGGGSVTLQHQYDDTLGGFTLSTTGGITTYTVNTSDTGVDACVRILRPNEQDPLYNTLVAQNGVGPTVFFQLLPAFQQIETGVNYSTQ